MVITKKDVIWNFVATIFKIGASVLLLPLVLKMLPSEEVGIWIIFSSISGFVLLLDFGFNSAFTRNITYIFSGVKELKVEGISGFKDAGSNIDYGLLSGIINAMRLFYFQISLLLLIIVGIFGTYYISILLGKYSGNISHIYFAWVLLVFISSYNLYTQYYEALLLGKGLVKRSKQITIIAQLVYLLIASVLVIQGFGLVAIVAAQSVAVVITRVLSYKIFFTNNIINSLKTAIPKDRKDIIKTIYPNAIKLGFTSLGAYLVSRSTVIIGSLYLSLDEIASYGVSMQVITLLISIAGIYTATYFPKIADLRVINKTNEIKDVYIRGTVVSIIIFIICGFMLVFFGNIVLHALGSKTFLIEKILLATALIISFLEMNQSIAGSILLTKNEVPFYKHSIIAGIISIILLIVFFEYSNLGLWGIILAPGIAHLYNNWKWPHEVYSDLGISIKDLKRIFVYS
jgi:O-antigen/teichoic acid export membrane protein